MNRWNLWSIQFWINNKHNLSTFPDNLTVPLYAALSTSTILNFILLNPCLSLFHNECDFPLSLYFSYYIIVGLSPFKGSLSAPALIEIPSLPSSLFKVISPIVPFFTLSYQVLKVLKSLSFYIELFLTPIFLLWLSSSPSFPSRQKFMNPQHISTIWPSSASYLLQLTLHTCIWLNGYFPKVPHLPM